MKTPKSVLVIGVAGCLSSALCSTALIPTASAADTSATLSLLQQPSLDAAVTKAQSSGTAPILPSPAALVLTAAKGQTAVGTLALKKSSTDQHTYYLSTNQSWVWMNPPYGSTQTITTETDQLVITAQTATLAAGTYSAVVYIVDSGPNNFTNMLRVPISLTVTATPIASPPPPPTSSSCSYASAQSGGPHTAPTAGSRGSAASACSGRTASRLRHGDRSDPHGIGPECGQGPDRRWNAELAQRRQRST